MKKSIGTVRVGTVAALAGGGLLLSAAGAVAAVPTTADFRALPQEGKATSCNNERVRGEAFGLGVEGAKDPAGKLTTGRGELGKDTALDILKQAKGGFITAVMVQGESGYNVYRVGFSPNSLQKFPYKDLVAPVEEGSKKAAIITGWAVCVGSSEADIGDTPNGVDDAPPLQNDTNVIPAPVSDAVPQLPRV